MLGADQRVLQEKAMIIGVLRIELYIPHSRSLKEKRREVKSIKERLRKNFNLSVAEIDNNDLWQRGSLGVTITGNEVPFVHEYLDRIVDFIERNWSHLILEISREVIKL